MISDLDTIEVMNTETSDRAEQSALSPLPKKSNDPRAYERALYARYRETILPRKRDASGRYLASPKGKATKKAYREKRKAFFRTYRREYYNNYYREHPEKLQRYQRTKRLKRDYGLTIDGYLELLKSQDHKCCICSKTLEDWGTDTNVDHCHKTGKIRGVLCGSCNCGIGYFRDSIKTLRSAIVYLERHK
jgi:Recombination endonuclease VII